MRAMQYMRNHSPEEIRSRLPERFLAPDAAADIEAIRQIVPMLSRDGMVSREGAEAVRKVLAVPP